MTILQPYSIKLHIISSYIGTLFLTRNVNNIASYPVYSSRMSLFRTSCCTGIDLAHKLQQKLTGSSLRKEARGTSFRVSIHFLFHSASNSLMALPTSGISSLEIFCLRGKNEDCVGKTTQRYSNYLTSSVRAETVEVDPPHQHQHSFTTAIPKPQTNILLSKRSSNSAE